MALSYNTNIFTQVNKWDKNGNPYGVLVSGKLNQYNQQGYPIIDAIDIDWNGAYVKNLNCYLYTTEDLINCLNISYANFNNYVSGSYLGYVINNIQGDFSYFANFTEQIYDDNQNTYNYLKELDYYLHTLDIALDNFKYITLDNISFFSIRYSEILDLNTNTFRYPEREYFLFDHTSYEYYSVDKNFILNNPNEIYYMSAVLNIKEDMERIQNIDEFIGKIEYDESEDVYTYTGLLEKLHNYDIELEEIDTKLDMAYEMAYTSYAYIDGIIKQVKINTENIGYHTSYNIYKPINQLTQQELNNYLALNNNKVYYKNNDGDYLITSYNQTYDGEYYVHYNVIKGSGIEREIEILEDKIYDNSYLLYKLNTKSNTPEYISLYIGPNTPGSQERTIETSLKLTNINPSTGDATQGLVTNSSLKDSFSYIFNWEILNKE